MSTLKIDRDCPIDHDWIGNQVQAIVGTCKKLGIQARAIKMCTSPGRKGNHFYITISPVIDANLANQLQYLLGDDGQRVHRNRIRIESGLNEWNKLFERSHVRPRTIYKA